MSKSHDICSNVRVIIVAAVTLEDSEIIISISVI